MSKTSRSQVIDLIKGLAIFTVVLGHCIQYGSGNNVLQNQLFYDNYVFKLIYSFHMPVFMIVSGYLFSISVKKYTTSTLVKKAIRTLLVPIVLWVLLYRIPEMVLSYSDYANIFKALIKLVSYIITGFWFLWAILFFQLFTLIVKKWFKDSIMVYTVTFIVLVCVPDFMITQLYKYMYLYFYIGYFSNNIIRSSRIKCTFNRYGWLFIVLTILMLSQFGYRTYIYNNTITLIPNGYESYVEQLKNIVLRYAIGITGSLGCIWLCIKIEALVYLKYLKGFLVLLGKKSLGIYIISGYIVSLIVVPVTANIVATPCVLALETALVILGSVLLTDVIQRIPVLNRCLLGGR